MFVLLHAPLVGSPGRVLLQCCQLLVTCVSLNGGDIGGGEGKSAGGHVLADGAIAISICCAFGTSEEAAVQEHFRTNTSTSAIEAAAAQSRHVR